MSKKIFSDSEVKSLSKNKYSSIVCKAKRLCNLEKITGRNKLLTEIISQSL